MKLLMTLLMLLGLHSNAAVGEETMAMMHHGSMMMDEKGMIMNANSDNLPKDCSKISGDVNIIIHAGQKHALKFPGKMFAFDNQEWDVAPCSSIDDSRLAWLFVSTRHVSFGALRSRRIEGIPDCTQPEKNLSRAL
ncbi:MAG: hypothetical protein WC685_12540 [Methylobacter sp.]|jgi:hypothetical protein